MITCHPKKAGDNMKMILKFFALLRSGVYSEIRLWTLQRLAVWETKALQGMPRERTHALPAGGNGLDVSAGPYVGVS